MLSQDQLSMLNAGLYKLNAQCSSSQLDQLTTTMAAPHGIPATGVFKELTGGMPQILAPLPCERFDTRGIAVLNRYTCPYRL